MDIFSQGLLGFGVAYLIGMSVIGYLFTLIAVRNYFASLVICRGVIFLHFVLGVFAMVIIPVIMYARLRGSLSGISVILFVIGGGFMALVVVLMSKRMNAIMVKGD